MRRQNNAAQAQRNVPQIVLETIENPYYGDDNNAPGSENHPGACNVVNVKVKKNPYYAM